MKHTNGPWGITPFNNDQILIEAPDFDICMIDIGETEEIDQANAILISSAPDMFQTIKEVSRLLEDPTKHNLHLIKEKLKVHIEIII